MQIKTTSYQDLLDSLCNELELNDKEILDIIDSSYKMFQQDHQILVIDDLYDYYYSIAKKNLKKEINQVSFYHVSRRLDGSDYNGYSLLEVLTGNNTLADYLRSYGLTFKYNNEIEMYVNDEKVIIPSGERNTPYLKYRFKSDYSFKGYMFADQLKNNVIISTVEGGPEFFGHLFNYIDNDEELIDNFIKQSKLYLFEYLVPIEEIYFEGYEELSNKEKQYHMIAKAMQRLYFYKYDKAFVESDEDNPIISMIDDKTLPANYLVNKIEL